jgi:hypothetical protein
MALGRQNLLTEHHDVTLTGSFAEQKRALLSLLQNAPLTA